jgi:hypothetical protein
MRMSDARVRLANSKVEMYAMEIATISTTNIDGKPNPDGHHLADQAIDILYRKTLALRNKHGIEPEVFGEIDRWLRSFNVFEFMKENNLQRF